MRAPGPLPRMQCRACGKDVAASFRVVGQLTEREHQCRHGEKCWGPGSKCPQCKDVAEGWNASAGGADKRKPVAGEGKPKKTTTAIAARMGKAPKPAKMPKGAARQAPAGAAADVAAGELAWRRVVHPGAVPFGGPAHTVRKGSKGKSAVCGFALDQFFRAAGEEMRDCRNCARMRESDTNPGERVAATASCTSIRGHCGPHNDRVRAAKKARREAGDAKTQRTLAETFAPELAGGGLADQDDVFEVFSKALADGQVHSVDALTREAERLSRCEVTSATVREVVAALEEVGICIRKGALLFPPGAQPSAAPSLGSHLPTFSPTPPLRAFFAPSAEPSPAAASDAEEAPGKIREREAWMLRFVEACRPWFEEVRAPLPAKIRVTMSLTRGKRVVAQCYARSASADGTNEILVRLDQAEAIEVADHLLHELCHAADDCQHRHGPGFARIAKAIGLVGPMKSTKLGDNARERCQAIIAALGPFPHAPLDVTTGRRSGPARQKNRHIKVVCVHEEDRELCIYTCRLSRTLIEQHGPPICPIHEEPMVVEEGPGGEEEDSDG